jgi:hypothetical protein
MDWKKSLLTSTEVWTGGVLVLAGVGALGLGVHGILAQALAPFGIGLVLSDVLTKAARAARERAKVRVRRDDE